MQEKWFPFQQFSFSSYYNKIHTKENGVKFWQNKVIYMKFGLLRTFSYKKG